MKPALGPVIRDALLEKHLEMTEEFTWVEGVHSDTTIVIDPGVSFSSALRKPRAVQPVPKPWERRLDGRRKR